MREVIDRTIKSWQFDIYFDPKCNSIIKKFPLYLSPWKNDGRGKVVKNIPRYQL